MEYFFIDQFIAQTHLCMKTHQWENISSTVTPKVNSKQGSLKEKELFKLHFLILEETIFFYLPTSQIPC